MSHTEDVDQPEEMDHSDEAPLSDQDLETAAGGVESGTGGSAIKPPTFLGGSGGD